MIVLKESVKIRAAPQKVFEALCGYLSDRQAYCGWHSDHVDLRWIRGEPLEEGSIVYAEEFLGSGLQKLKFKIVKVIPYREIVYRPLFPYSLFAPGNIWLFQPKGEKACIFTAVGRLRGGPLYRILSARRLKALKSHMRQEGENLKKTLETGDAGDVEVPAQTKRRR